MSSSTQHLVHQMRKPQTQHLEKKNTVASFDNPPPYTCTHRIQPPRAGFKVFYFLVSIRLWIAKGKIAKGTFGMATYEEP